MVAVCYYQRGLMNRSRLMFGAALALAAVFSFTAPSSVYAATAMVNCKDGTTSKGGKGACSSHGGVDKGAKAGTAAAPEATPAAKPAAAPAADAKPAATAAAKPAAAAAGPATAKCKDGTMSHSKQHSGACSKHGGVAQWLDGT